MQPRIGGLAAAAFTRAAAADPAFVLPEPF
jgi:hypothetical protein